jgi:AAA ATPase domain
MRLTRIEIENFKGIGSHQSIDLRPITLLFGANSAGKSTVLQALHYVREILERGNPDPDQTIAGGLIDLGGFATLVHNHDLNRAITIKLVLDLSGDRGSERLPLNSGEYLSEIEFQQLGVRYLVGCNTELEDDAVVKCCGVSLEVRWSDLLGGPYVSRISVDLDGEHVAAIYSPAQSGRAIVTDFNLQHPLLQEIVDVENAEHDSVAIGLEAVNSTGEGFDDGDPMASPLGGEVWELSREVASLQASELPVGSSERSGERAVSNAGVRNPEFVIRCATRIGALPDLDRPLWLDLVEVDIDDVRSQFASGSSVDRMSREQDAVVQAEIDEERQRRTGLLRLLDELLLGPLRLCRDHLQEMTYIGPLRAIPQRSFRPRLSPDESRWAHGLAAWDLLYTDTTDKLIDSVNEWLAGEGKLGTGYRLEKSSIREVRVPSRLHQIFERGLNEEDVGELQELYGGLEARTEIALRDFEKGISVAPGDVGVGISQMIPVIVASVRFSDGILTVEQPELHVHPAIQVGLGDLFIEAIQPDEALIGTGKSLLIETHSEHIMLRLLRRIREKSTGSLPPGVRGLTPSDLSVVYVESSDEGVRFVPLRVAEDGDFLDQWPKGFFEERAEELF